MSYKLERLHGQQGDHVKLYKSGKWVFASRKDKPVVEGNEKPDAVVIIAYDNRGRLLVVRERRPIVGDYIWGFPAGLVDKDETILEAAAREVKEETGLRFRFRPEVDRYYVNSFSSPGITDEKVAVVTGFVEGEISKAGQEIDEDIEPHLMSADDLVSFNMNYPSQKMSIWLAIHLLG